MIINKNRIKNKKHYYKQQKPMRSYKARLYHFLCSSDENENLTRNEITFLEGLYGMMCAGTYNRFVTQKQIEWMETILNDRKKAVN